MFKILHKIKPFGPMSSPETSDVMLIFLLAFFLWPRYYYNDNKPKGNMFEGLMDLSVHKVVLIELQVPLASATACMEYKCFEAA